MRVQLTVLGSGTSMGVPTIACRCPVCLSADPRDNRTRPSILLRYGGRAVVIDTTPDFRFQALRSRLDRLDAILYTHSHADHILGLDDIRPFSVPSGVFAADTATKIVVVPHLIPFGGGLLHIPSARPGQPDAR